MPIFQEIFPSLLNFIKSFYPYREILQSKWDRYLYVPVCLRKNSEKLGLNNSGKDIESWQISADPRARKHTHGYV